jgi:transposase
VYRLDGVEVGHVAIEGEVVTIKATPAAAAGVCPDCGQRSTRVHSRYRRMVEDLPSCGRRVRVALTVRRFRCGTPDCPRRTFAEQVAGVTAPHRPRAQRLEAVLGAFGAALGGRAGARLAGQAGMPVSGDTLLRLVRRGAPGPAAVPRVLGVDDWSWRRGLRFGTILVDLEAGRAVDLLPERTSDGLRDWLQARPGIEVIARDRSTEYARGATVGAPAAVQVLDRWHVLRNVREVAERILERHPDQLRALGTSAPEAPPPVLPPRRSAHEEARRAGARGRAIERYEAVGQLAASGLSERAIAKRLGLARGTVRRYRHAAGPPERATPARRPGILDPYVPYLERRWAEECRNGLQLWREIRGQGFPGSRKQVSRWVQARRPAVAPTTPRRYRPRPGATSAPTLPPTGRRPSARRLAWLLVRAPADLGADEQGLLSRLQAACPDAATAYPLLQEFVRLVRERCDGPLDGWFAAATASTVPDLRSFAVALREDAAALRAALQLPWSTSPVEGHITRLKLLKRQGYGRAGLETLRGRLLYAA